MNETKNTGKQNIIRTVIFLGILFLLTSLFSYAVRPDGYDVYNLTNFTRTADKVRSEDEHTVDVLFCGDSEAADAFSPLQFWGEQGISSYNIANPAQRLCDTYALIYEAFRTQDVKVIVLETGSLFEEADLYDTSDPSLAFMEKMFPIVHYHQVYRSLKPKNVSWGAVSTSDILKGFWLKTGVRAYEGPEDYMGDPASEPSVLSDSVLEYLDQILALCNEHDASLVLMSTPLPAAWNYSRHNAVQQWADENNVLYEDLNLCDELDMDWSQDTSDGGTHLSFTGTLKVCSWAGRYLMDQFSLTDHRGDSAYDSWQNAYDEADLYPEVTQ